jgi:signal transduction histidine kinase
MAGNRTARVAQSVRSELDHRLELRVHDRLLVSNQPVQAFLDQADGGGRERPAATLGTLRSYLARLFLQYGDYYDELVLADARGEPLLRYERSGASLARGEIPASPGVRALPRDPGSEASRPENLPPLQGIASAGAGFRDADRRLFQTGPGLEPAAFRLHVDPIEAGSAPTVSVLMPVQSNERPDVRLGYVLARIRAQHLWPPDWASRRFGERGELVIVSKVGEEVLYHTRREWIGRRLNEVDRDLSRVAGPVSSQGPEAWSWASGREGRRVVTVLDAAAAPWKVVATAYPREFATEARRAALLNLAIATLVLVMAATVLVIASGRVSRSIKMVTAGAQRIAGGDLLGPPILAETHDEIESLADAFNVMTTALRRNIAMREQTAAELDVLNRSLESRVQERTRELESLNAALNRANEELKELDRLKSNFLATVSHEFKTPLTSIKAFAEILHDELEEQGASDELRRFLKIIDAESDRLARLIKNVLDLSRIESGRMIWRMADFPVAHMVEAAIDGLLPALREKQIRLEPQLACGDARLHGDQDRIQEVVYNVLDNAIKASTAGQRIVIACREAHESANGPSRTLRISVQDEGDGIPADQIERIFDRFHQVGAHGKRRRGGTGLGLAISREITEHHGGRIWAESTPGRGSTFHITLPLATASGPHVPPGEGPSHPADTTPEDPPHG